MDKRLLAKSVVSTICDVLDLTAEEISITTMIDQVDEWDSLAQINIISQLEKEFSIFVEIEAFEKLLSVQDIVDLIEVKSKT